MNKWIDMKISVAFSLQSFDRLETGGRYLGK
jgi:hypothetical protein